MGERNDLIERLLNPLWAHMRGGEPHLDDEATLADLKEAADTIAILSEALAEAEKKGAEAERLRFEGDLDKWMKTLGAGITGYQPEVYAVMDAACAELVKLRTEVKTLRNTWSSDMSAMPRGQDVVVYQPPHKAGRTTLPARICEVRNAGYTRESTHWMVPAPPFAQGERG